VRWLPSAADFRPCPSVPPTTTCPRGWRATAPLKVYPLTPDLAKARLLMAQAHVRRATAVLYTLSDFPHPEQAQIVKDDLAKIGIKVNIQTFSSDIFFARLVTPGAPFDLAYDGWFEGYPDPDDFLNGLLDDSANGPTFADPVAQRRLAAAARLSGPQRYLTYGALDIDLVRDAAPLAAFANGSVHDFFSPRIGCQNFGIYGMDLDALCTRPASG
jgi:ABC-type transport system substrate-binding protein